MDRIAEYYPATKRIDGVVNISAIDNGRRVLLAEHKVDSKRAARAVAAQYDALPHNF
jgi:hypothetical protein